MGYHPRIESNKRATFVTTRTKGSELWFANNKPVENFALAHLAKVKERYEAKVYAYSLSGSHYHLPAHFPRMNRASFARDYNSGLAVAVDRLTCDYPGGRLWQRRYSGEMIAGDEDIERQFFYTVLQPVSDGLVERLSEYPFYNCFHDAVYGIEKTFKMINHGAYQAAKRKNPKVSIRDFIEKYTLKYERIPGYEHLSQREYELMMERKLEEHRLEIIREREKNGKFGFVGRAALLKVKPGTRAKNPKVSDIRKHRPRVLSSCHKRRSEARDWYFGIYYAYKKASRKFLAGDLLAEFPFGTYRPPAWIVSLPAGPFSVL